MTNPHAAPKHLNWPRVDLHEFILGVHLSRVPLAHPGWYILPRSRSKFEPWSMATVDREYQIQRALLPTLRFILIYPANRKCFLKVGLSGKWSSEPESMDGAFKQQWGGHRLAFRALNIKSLHPSNSSWYSILAFGPYLVLGPVLCSSLWER